MAMRLRGRRPFLFGNYVRNLMNTNIPKKKIVLFSALASALLILNTAIILLLAHVFYDVRAAVQLSMPMSTKLLISIP
jgi:hypothetical protein